jgi:hypothetical protein
MKAKQRPKQLIFITIMVALFGIAMFVYWGMFIIQQIPILGIPILSESITACLAIVTAIGIMRMKSWSVPFSLVLSGLWGYGVIAGIQLVLENGLDFSSPFGALTDAILFPLILIYAVYMAFYMWCNRSLFEHP